MLRLVQRLNGHVVEGLEVVEAAGGEEVEVGEGRRMSTTTLMKLVHWEMILVWHYRLRNSVVCWMIIMVDGSKMAETTVNSNSSNNSKDNVQGHAVVKEIVNQPHQLYGIVNQTTLMMKGDHHPLQIVNISIINNHHNVNSHTVPTIKDNLDPPREHSNKINNNNSQGQVQVDSMI